MRLRLLTEWTNALKRIGQRLICFMLLVFKTDYKSDEVYIAYKDIGIILKHNYSLPNCIDLFRNIILKYFNNLKLTYYFIFLVVFDWLDDAIDFSFNRF